MRSAMCSNERREGEGDAASIWGRGRDGEGDAANTIVEAIRVTWTANADAKIAGVLPAISRTQWCG